MKRLGSLAFLILGLAGWIFAQASSNQTFFDLCMKGTADQVVAAIKAGASVNSVAQHGPSLLSLIAAQNGSVKAFSTKIQNPSSEAENGTNDTPLMFAAAFSPDLAVVAALLDNGAEPKHSDSDGLTPMAAAAMNNQNPEVVIALAAAIGGVNSSDDSGVTPLVWAAGFNPNLAVVSALIKDGATINPLKSGAGMTPLGAAASFNQNPDTIRLLIAAGADVNAIPKQEDGISPLMEAAKHGSLQAVLTLLKAGAKVDEQSASGTTALLAAIEGSNSPGIVEALLYAGADVNEANRDSETPLILEVKNADDMAVIDKLVGAGANVNHQDFFGMSALFDAIDRAADAKASLDKFKYYGVPGGWAKASDLPWYQAQYDETSAVVDYLIKHGANVEQRTIVGVTPLMASADPGSATWDAAPSALPEIVKELLASGANVNDRDIEGMTALMYAAHSRARGEGDVVQLLLGAHADTKLKDSKGKTAWDYAQDNPNLKNTPAYWALNNARF